MGLFRRKSRVEQVVGPIVKSVAAVKAVPAVTAKLGNSKAMKSGLAAAGGLIGLTAGSAAVSSARRRSETSRGPA
jgi:hypothetical protein